MVTGDVKMGATPEQALDGIRLVMLANDVSLRNLIPAELAKGFGFFQSKPATAFSPVAVTLDELGEAWDKGRVHLTLQSTWNGRKVGMCEAGPGNDLPLRPADRAHRQDAQRARRQHRRLRHGEQQGRRGQGRQDRMAQGLQLHRREARIETIQDGKPSTEFMKFGDTIRIEMKGKDGQSVFGAIDRRSRALGGPSPSTLGWYLRPMRSVPLSRTMAWCWRNRSP